MRSVAKVIVAKFWVVVLAISGFSCSDSNPGNNEEKDGSLPPTKHLVFTIQPTTTKAGGWISPAVQVSVLDDSEKPVSSESPGITLQLGANPGGAGLLGKTMINASSGVAEFPGLRINTAATGFTLVASAEGLASVTSIPFDIVPGDPSRLAFAVQPGSPSAGEPFDPIVVVSLLDAFDNPVRAATNSVSLSLGNNPTGGALSGTTTVDAVAGRASFPDLFLEKAGGGYTLVAYSPGLNEATSNAFDVTAGAISQLRFETHPSDTIAGEVMTPAVVVILLDLFGNKIIEANARIGLELGNNPSGTTLQGTTAVAHVDGGATFSDLSVRALGAGYTLVASTAGLASVTSEPFDVSASVPARLSFLVQPQAAAAGTTLSPPIEVAIQDTLGNTVPTATDPIALAIGDNPGGGTLSGTTTVSAVAGVARFENLSIDKTGGSYTLLASAPARVGATSSPFDIGAGEATRLAFRVQPSLSTAGEAIAPAVVLAPVDAFGNTVPTFSGQVDLRLGSNPGSTALLGTTSVELAAGFATFSDLRLENAASGYTLVASSAGLQDGVSAQFDVVAGTVAEIVFAVQPGNVLDNFVLAPAIQVRFRDRFGNTAFVTDSVGLRLGNNPAAGVLNGMTSANAVAGIAVFPDLSIDKPGLGYTLIAFATGLAEIESAAFDVIPAVSNTSTIVARPDRVAADGVAASTIIVTLLDDATGTPLADQVVTLQSSRAASDTVVQSSNPTDAAGVTSGLVQSSSMGVSTIRALNATNGIRVAQTATVIFTPALGLLAQYDMDVPSGRELAMGDLGGAADSDLVGLWHFNETGGLAWTDASGHGLDGRTGASRLANFGFENGTGVDATDWVESGNADRVSDRAFEGAYSMKFSGAMPLGQATNQANVAVSPSTRYEISAWVYNNLTAGAAYLDLNDLPEECNAMATRTSGVWQFVSCAFTTAAGRTLLTVRMVVDGAPAGEVWFDNVSVNQIPIANRASGKFKTALSLDGVDDYVVVPDYPSLQLGSNMTVAAWIKPVSNPIDWTRLVGKGSVTARNYGLWRHIDGDLLWQIYSPSGTMSCWNDLGPGNLGNAPVGVWTHVAGTYDGQELRLYVNGTLTRSCPGNFLPYTSADPLTIGYPGFHTYFHGNMDEVAVFRTTLTAEQILDHYRRGIVPDVSGNGLDGDLGGPISAGGIFEEALAFGGLEDRVEVNADPSLDLDHNTVEAWIYPVVAQADWAPIVVKEVSPFASPYYVYGLTFDNAGHVRYCFSEGVHRCINGTTVIPLSEWTHVAGSYDGNKVRLFVDGVEEAAADFSTPLLASSGPLRIGSTSGGAFLFAGRIDRVKVFDRALQPPEIAIDSMPP